MRSEPLIGALIEVHRALPSTLLAAVPSTFLIFPIFLSAFLSFSALHPSIRWNRATSALFTRGAGFGGGERGRTPTPPQPNRVGVRCS